MLVAGIADPGWIAYNRMESGIIDAGYNKRGRRLPHSKALRELELAANVRKLFGCANSLALSSSRAERKDVSDGLQHPTSDSHRRQSCSRERFLNWSSIMP
ncbi:MAG: hypothetical protein DME40_13250 [Verrucomicrobia bacterium]|nr:MAG: hypothetical protein DME40_13250 [Verrucomicrobiota bacterium]PYL75287.1 MAG: hypothetical protein DMF27_12490 [Verrucomicrobiota bacterium]